MLSLGPLVSGEEAEHSHGRELTNDHSYFYQSFCLLPFNKGSAATITTFGNLQASAASPEDGYC